MVEKAIAWKHGNEDVGKTTSLPLLHGFHIGRGAFTCIQTNKTASHLSLCPAHFAFLFSWSPVFLQHFPFPLFISMDILHDGKGTAKYSRCRWVP